MRTLLLLAFLIGVETSIQASPIAFPAGFVPFTSIDYVTRPLPDGDRLVLGESYLAAARVIQTIPLPSLLNEVFSDAFIQLAPGQFFSNVYVPTARDRAGDYSEFGGLLTDPLTGAPFPGGIIPVSRLFGLYAFRLGPASTATPEPTSFALLVLGALFGFIALRRKHCRGEDSFNQ